MRLILTEGEKIRIKKLYEQSDSESIVKAAKLDDLSVKLLPNEFVKEATTQLLKDKELINKLNKKFNTDVTSDPLNFLISKGITPYLFVVPDYTSLEGRGFPTTGLSVNIDNTPFTINLNLGTNPMKVLGALKFSQMRLSLPINK